MPQALPVDGFRWLEKEEFDMHLFIVKGLRGGISMISHRHAKANNIYVLDYDPSQPSSHVTYLDAKNLHGWAMSQALPVGGFRWLEKEEFEHLNINYNVFNHGCCLKVMTMNPGKSHSQGQMQLTVSVMYHIFLFWM
jgi:hypothetical protein